jgi:hypothetical protein
MHIYLYVYIYIYIHIYEYSMVVPVPSSGSSKRLKSLDSQESKKDDEKSFTFFSGWYIY